MTPGKLLSVAVAATGMALVVVWQSAAIRGVGYRLQELRSEITEQEAQQAIYRAQISKLSSPQRIRRLVTLLGLELHQPPVEAAGVVDGEGGAPLAGPSGIEPSDAPTVAVAQRPRSDAGEAQER